MNEYKQTIITVMSGAGYGLLGYAIGIMFLFGKMTLGSSVRYAIVALISGGVSFQMAEKSMNGYSYAIAIGSGLFLFFIIKIILSFLYGASDNPDDALDKIIEFIKSFKK